jgi:hypothetical protein
MPPRRGHRPSSPPDPFPSRAEIAARAEQLAMSSPSSTRTTAAQWWRQAESELLDKAARRAVWSDLRSK